MTRSLWLLSLIACAATNLSAQPVPLARVGDRVRVSTTADSLRPHWSVGTLLAFDRSQVQIAEARSAISIAIPRVDLTRFEVSRGRRSKWLTGLGLGFLGGAFLGATAGLLADRQGNDLAPRDAALLGAGFGAASGLLVGTLIGASKRGDVWRPAQLPGEGPSRRD